MVFIRLFCSRESETRIECNHAGDGHSAGENRGKWGEEGTVWHCNYLNVKASGRDFMA